MAKGIKFSILSTKRRRRISREASLKLFERTIWGTFNEMIKKCSADSVVPGFPVIERLKKICLGLFY